MSLCFIQWAAFTQLCPNNQVREQAHHAVETEEAMQSVHLPKTAKQHSSLHIESSITQQHKSK